MGEKDGVGIVEGGCVLRTEGAAGRVHCPHAVQVLVPVDGPLAATVDGAEVKVPSGNAMLIAPDVPRALHRGVRRVALLFDPESFGASFGGAGRSASTTILSGTVGERLQGLARDLFDVPCLDPSTVSAALDEGRRILAQVGFAQASEIDPRVRTAVELYRRPGLQLDHPSIARRAGISADHLSHLFKRQVGISAKRYALWVRTVAAVERVCGGASTTRAAEQVQFADVSHFSRACNRHFGHAPSRLPFARPETSHCGVERKRGRWSVALAARLDTASAAH